MGQAVTAGTREIYTKVWADVMHFMAVQLEADTDLPFPPDCISMYVVYMFDNGLAANTIRQKLSAISYLHKLHRLQDPCKDFIVINVLKAVVKQSAPTEPKAPINVGLLECILEVTADVVQDTYKVYLYRAIFTTLYYSCLRIGECVVSNEDNNTALLRSQVCFLTDHHSQEPSAYFLSFRNFKHRNGRKVPPVKVEAESSMHYCPVNLLYRYSVISDNGSDYMFVSQTGALVKSSDVAGVLQLALVKLKLDPTKYSTHSFRVGKITDVLAEGRSTERVRALGRWRSSAQDVYNRPAFILA